MSHIKEYRDDHWHWLVLHIAALFFGIIFLLWGLFRIPVAFIDSWREAREAHEQPEMVVGRR